MRFLIEEYIKGEEITCPVFNNELFPVLTIKSNTEFYDYEQKYSANGAPALSNSIRRKDL